MPKPILLFRDGKVFTHDLVHGLREAMPSSKLVSERDVLAKAIWLERNGFDEKAEELLEWFINHNRLPESPP